MARNKTEKILVSFEKPALIKKLIGDIEIVENRSFSSVVERFILTKLMPENIYAQQIVEKYLYSDNGSVTQTLLAMFYLNAEGVNGKTTYNMLPLVQFSVKQELFRGTSFTDKEKELQCVYTQMQIIIEKLSSLFEKTEEKNEKNYYEKEVKRGTEILQEIKEEPTHRLLIDCYQFLLDNWKDLESWTATYKIIYNLVKIGNWKDDTKAELKIELLELIKNISFEQ